MRVAFFGLPLGALLLRRDGHDIVLAAISRPNAVGSRRLRRLLGTERTVAKPDAEGDDLYEHVRVSRPDLVVSWFWTTRLPRRVLELGPLGAFGVHPSLLPRHRGPDPYFWAIDSGDVETGVTAHRLEDKYDTGPILARRSMAIDPSWNAWTLAKKLDRPSLALLRQVVRAFASGAPPAAVPQDEAQATLAPEPDESLLAVQWNRVASAIVRRVRAASPWPGAFTIIGEETITLTRVRRTEDFPRVLVAGEGAVRRDGVGLVRARDAAVELLEGRDEEDRALGAAALAERIRRAGPG